MRRNSRALAGIALLSAGAVIASALIGPASIPLEDALAALFGAGDDRAVSIVRDLRLPRALAAFAAGAALAASGAALQGLLRNPLADPGVLGVSSAAALGAVVAVYFNLSAATSLATPLAAILAAIAAVALLYALGAGRVSPTRLILIGVGLSAFTGALIALAMNLAPNPFVLSDLVNWLFGAVTNRSFEDLALVLPFMAAGLVAALLARDGLSALSLGEETAQSVGADLPATRMLAISGAALMTGASVALAGAIGFVGVVAPHVARAIGAADPGRAILPAALIGGGMLSAADVVIRLLPFDQELKLGVAAALIGAPAFVWIAARTQRLVR
jgi:iron complex transport system permease protein